MTERATPQQQLDLAQEILELLERKGIPESPYHKIGALVLALIALTSVPDAMELLGAKAR